MFGSNEKAQKAVNAMRKGHFIMQLGSRRCNSPADSKQNSSGVQRTKPSEVSRSHILCNLRRG